MAEPSVMQVYKNEDVNNPEYATVEEVRQAFFGRGVFIKTSSGDYEQVVAFNQTSSKLYTNNSTYTLAEPA